MTIVVLYQFKIHVQIEPAGLMSSKEKNDDSFSTKRPAEMKLRRPDLDRLVSAEKREAQ